MANSLLVANQVELLGGGTVATDPRCAGAIFRLGDDTGWDLGTPQPTADYVASLILDGERPVGRRASNRTIKLPVTIKGTDPNNLASAREVLLEAIDQQMWELRWTRDAGPGPLVLDCYRAQPTVVAYSIKLSAGFYSLVQLTFTAQPYGRSDTRELLPIATPLEGNPTPAAPVVLDNYSSTSGGGTGWSRTTKAVIGPYSAKFTPAISHTDVWYGPVPVAGSPRDLTGLTALSLWFGAAWDYTHYHYWAGWNGQVRFDFTLYDANGATLGWAATRKVAYSSSSTPAWTQLSAPIPGPGVAGSFDFAHVTQYKIRMATWQDDLAWIQVYLDTLRAVPPTEETPAAIRGQVYHVRANGTARTPAAVQLQNPSPQAQQQILLTGSGVWIPPFGVPTAKVATYGGGGAGGTRTTSGSGGGGGGGEYAAENALALTGDPLAYVCGAGGIPASIPAQSVVFNTAGTFPFTVPAGVTSLKVEGWGGGGGGAGAWAGNSFGVPGGGGGEYAAEAAVAVAASTSYNAIVAAGGAGGNPGQDGAAGGLSQFAGTSVTVSAHGGGGGPANNTGGGASGGGSVNATHFAGGAGAAGDRSNAGHADGGGGGGAAGSAGTGGAAPPVNVATGLGAGGTGAGTAPSNGGNGGNGQSIDQGVGAVWGHGPGGGGGGAGNTLTTGYQGGRGADGQIRITWTTSATPAVNGGQTIFGNPQPLNANPNFNGGTMSPWTQGTGTTATATDIWATGTSQTSVVFTGNGSTASPGISSEVFTGVTGNHVYSAFAVLYSPQGWTQGQVGINWYTSAGVFISSSSGPVINVAAGVTSGTVVSLGNVTSPSTAGKAQMYVLMLGTPPSTVTMFCGYGIVYDPAVGALVTANGGQSAALNSATGGTAGSGSTNSVHFPGGAGAAGATGGGGGGASGSSAGAGAAGSGTLGGSVPGGSGAGPGGTGAPNPSFAGTNGAQPGGGGGGAATSGAAESGGYGGPGQVAVTYTPPISPFKTFIAHTPGPDASRLLNPQVPIPVTDTPNGGTEYPVQSLQAPLNARFGSTYSLVLAGFNFDTPANARTVTITVHQYEYAGGPSYPSAVSCTFTPAVDAVNGLVQAGNLTLPGKYLAQDNASAYFTVSITDSNANDRYMDVLFLDTMGQTAIIASQSPYLNYWLDEPDPLTGMGPILASQYDRDHAVSALDAMMAVSGGPLTLYPGDNLLFAYSLEGAPALGVSYFPRWHVDRQS